MEYGSFKRKTSFITEERDVHKHKVIYWSITQILSGVVNLGWGGFGGIDINLLSFKVLAGRYFEFFTVALIHI